MLLVTISAVAVTGVRDSSDPVSASIAVGDKGGAELLQSPKFLGPAGISREAESNIDSSNPLSISSREIENRRSENSVATAASPGSANPDATAAANGPISGAANQLSVI